MPKSLDGKHDAITDYEITHQAKYERTSDGGWRLTEVNVTLSIKSASSWVVTGKEGDQLLKHEQTHYEISAIAARQLEARPTGLSGDKSQKPADGVAAVARKVVGERDAMGKTTVRGLLQEVHDRYDEDLTCGTDHGRRKNNQVRWDHRVSKTIVDKKGTLSGLNSCPPNESDAVSGE
ncbi:MAG: hypothetical protein WKF37_24155 [Bryobacteraceae bacterium]